MTLKLKVLGVIDSLTHKRKGPWVSDSLKKFLNGDAAWGLRSSEPLSRDSPLGDLPVPL